MLSRGDAELAEMNNLFALAAWLRFEFLRHQEGDCHSDCWPVPRARDAIRRFLDRKLSHDGARFREARGVKR
jgi:hypothetical protein